MEIKELIEDAIYSNPLVLLTVQDESLLQLINDYLPYSIGIEIECPKSNDFNLSAFTSIPDIMDVNITSGEQRFRIPNGLAGLVCLFNICEQLKINSELNPESGHHYHIDMTNGFDQLTNEYVKANADWMLKELDSWGYTGKYNTRTIELSMSANWVRFQPSFKTAEFRIGNMTFDYSIIVKRLIHACQIIKRLKSPLINDEIIYKKSSVDINNCIKFDINLRLEQLKGQLQQSKPIQVTTPSWKEVIKKRVIKL